MTDVEAMAWLDINLSQGLSTLMFGKNFSSDLFMNSCVRLVRFESVVRRLIKVVAGMCCFLQQTGFDFHCVIEKLL